jgi:hypothetical protein
MNQTVSYMQGVFVPPRPRLRGGLSGTARFTEGEPHACHLDR